MKQKLHRSMTFWSGLLVMGFICWAGAYSGPYPVGWTHAPHPTTSLSVDSTCGRLCFARKVAKCGAGGPWISFRSSGFRALSPGTRRDVDLGQARWFPPFEISRRSEPVAHFVGRVRVVPVIEEEQVAVPYWTLLLAVALSWSGLLVWRVRRRKRAVLTAE